MHPCLPSIPWSPSLKVLGCLRSLTALTYRLVGLRSSGDPPNTALELSLWWQQARWHSWRQRYCGDLGGSRIWVSAWISVAMPWNLSVGTPGVCQLPKFPFLSAWFLLLTRSWVTDPKSVLMNFPPCDPLSFPSPLTKHTLLLVMGC